LFVFCFFLFWTALLDFDPCLADYEIWITLLINCCFWISVPCVFVTETAEDVSFLAALDSVVQTLSLLF